MHMVYMFVALYRLSHNLIAEGVVGCMVAKGAYGNT